jgi:hypothetical protein
VSQLGLFSSSLTTDATYPTHGAFSTDTTFHSASSTEITGHYKFPAIVLPPCHQRLHHPTVCDTTHGHVETGRAFMTYPQSMGLDLPMTIRSSKFTQYKDVEGMDPLQVPLGKFSLSIYIGLRNDWLRRLAHGREVKWSLSTILAPRPLSPICPTASFLRR